MKALKVESITLFYGVAQALFDVSLEVNAGEVLALLGRNGMGKSSTINAICRIRHTHSGRISVFGQEINHLPSHKVALLGVGLVPEGRRCFANLTIEQNLMAVTRRGYWDFSRVFALFPKLSERRKQLSASLSGGEQQMLSIARALVTNPRLLIFDEATEGLAPIVRGEIWAAINDIKNEGQSIVIVDKSIKELAQIADRAVILSRGTSVWQGNINTMPQSITEQYLGI